VGVRVATRIVVQAAAPVHSPPPHPRLAAEHMAGSHRRMPEGTVNGEGGVNLGKHLSAVLSSTPARAKFSRPFSDN